MQLAPQRRVTESIGRRMDTRMSNAVLNPVFTGSSRESGARILSQAVGSEDGPRAPGHLCAVAHSHCAMAHIYKSLEASSVKESLSSNFPPRLTGDGSLRKSDSVSLRKEPFMANKARPSAKSSSKPPLCRRRRQPRSTTRSCSACHPREFELLFPKLEFVRLKTHHRAA